MEENNGLALVETAPGLRELWHVEVADMNIGRTAWAPDGSWIALTSGDGNLYRVDPKDGSRKLFAALPGEGNEAAAFSPDGKFLYTGTDGGRLCIFDASSGRLLNPAGAGSKPIRDELDVPAAVLTTDERAVWVNRREGILEIPLDGGPVRKIAGDDDLVLMGRAGTNLVLAAGEQSIILDDSGNITGNFEDDKALVLRTATKLLEPLAARAGPAFHAWLFQSNDGFDRGNDLLTCFDFSPDGRLAVFFDSLDNTLALWDLVRDRRVPLPLPEEFYPEQVGFSPLDPNTFFVTDAEDLLVFDLHPGTVEGSITPEEFAAALQRLSSGRFREREDGSRRLKAGGSATLALLKTTSTPDDPEVAGRLDEIRDSIEATLVPATTLRTTDFSQLPYTMTRFAPLSGGLLVATRSAGVMLFRLRDGVIEILDFAKTPSPPVCLALSRDGRRVVTGNANGTVSVFRLE
ncbi:MAG: WD40 repeat domain-containing protein [Kiritimatiellia bacterium]